jgi:hypothetical protein
MKLILRIFFALCVVLFFKNLLVNSQWVNKDDYQGDDQQQDDQNDRIADYLDLNDDASSNKARVKIPKNNDNLQYIPTTAIDAKSAVTQPNKDISAKKNVANNDHLTDNSNSWTVFFILCVLGIILGF